MEANTGGTDMGQKALKIIFPRDGGAPQNDKEK